MKEPNAVFAQKVMSQKFEFVTNKAPHRFK